MKRKMMVMAAAAMVALAFQAPTAPLLTWRVLEKVDFEEKYVKEIEGYMLFPKFPAGIKQHDGKVVQVVGYVVPMDNTGNTIALSANPYEACFFCGKAGPASVMTLKLKKPDKTYRIDDYIAFKGKLRLNNSDINEFYYILEQAEPLGKK
ncbi:MAG: hypothetical protein MUF62_03600 [Chitinophagaceae bacterium]|jgi:hypothetical protein|nr:hypothetical protein [Chitinophagaceae bacterium]